MGIVMRLRNTSVIIFLSQMISGIAPLMTMCALYSLKKALMPPSILLMILFGLLSCKTSLAILSREK